MKINLIAAGTRLPDWINTGFNEYAQRLPSDCRLELNEISLGRRQGKNPDIARAMRSEGERMLAAAASAKIVALEVTGQAWSTEALAKQLAAWRQEGQDIALCIGGPDGLAPTVQQRAGQRWSLSPLTLPHGLARVLVAEQLYRAWSILNNHPYHRGDCWKFEAGSYFV